MSEYSLLMGLIGAGIGFGVAYWVKGQLQTQKIKAADEEAQRIVDDAKRRSETLLKEAMLEAKDKLFLMKSEFDAETRETRAELKKQENRLIQKEENIDRKNDKLQLKEQELSDREVGIADKEEALLAEDRR
ncbi:MAG: Rnase Y domain-containing protein [Desulfococcus multivorans]|jgi:ribonuclease Y|nr:Rnase Y domain-containing protein [Desulfococcus multivorans]